MPLALSGATDTGRTKTVTMSVKVQLKNLQVHDFGAAPTVHPGDSGWDDFATKARIDGQGVLTGGQDWSASIEGVYYTASGPLYGRIVYLYAPWVPGGYLILEDVNDVVPVSGDSAEYTITISIGPIREGDAHSNIGPPEFPNLWTNREIVRSPWYDGYTVMNISVSGGGGSSGNLYYVGGIVTINWSSTQDVNQSPFNVVSIGSIGIGTRTWSDSDDMVIVRDWTTDGVIVDTQDLTDYLGFSSSGSGGYNVRIDGSIYLVAAAPYRFEYDCRISKFGEDANNWARVLDNYITPVQLYPLDGAQKSPQQDYLTFPANNGSYAVQVTSWHRRTKSFGGTVFFTLDDSWRTSHDPQLPSDDTKIPIRGWPSLINPTTRAKYNPFEIKLESSLNVHRPDGNTPSSWVSPNAKISVAEGANTVLTVNETGGEVTRTFLTNWRNLTTPGDALFEIEGYRKTKHPAGKDAAWWGMYALLQIEITAPTADDLILQVNWTDAQFTDPHTTGSHRETNFQRAEFAKSASYTIPLSSGFNSVTIDLMFPSNGAGPCYPTWVDSLKLTGFAVGTYTISAINLITAASDGYFKNAIGIPRVRGDYSCLNLIAAGAGGLQHLPDTANKADEIDHYLSVELGGNIRYCDPLTGHPSGIIMDFQRSLSDFVDALNQVEGVVANYDSAAYDAAFKDSYGVSTGSEMAEWIHPQVPFLSFTPGTLFEPDCSATVRRVRIPNGFDYKIWVDWPLYGGLEAVVSDGGVRAGAGETVEAYREDTGATVETGTTDLYGYVVVSPIPANENRIYGLRVP